MKTYNEKYIIEYIYCERCNQKHYLAKDSAKFNSKCKCGKNNNLRRKSNPIKIYEELV